MGNIPVTLYNGLPNISLPIFTVSTGSISLPITLDYGFSGLKPKEDASWVGMGWNLGAGGVVTRIVKGDPDGSQNSGQNYGDINAWDSALNYPQNQTFFANVTLHNYDAEPDIFSFNFNGRSGKFIYYHGKGYVMPYMKLNISMAGDQSFVKIIDEGGTEYLFQGVETSTPHPQPDYSMPAYKSSWFLSKIISADLNDTISLTYNTVQVQEGASPYSETYNQWNTQSCPGDPAGQDYGIDHYSGYSYGGTQVSALQLYTITSRNLNVYFGQTTWNRADVSGTYPALGNITVSNNFGDILKIFSLNYSYFGDSATGYNAKLRLDSLCEITGQPRQTYAFGYNGGTVLPDKRTLGIDYWGYYNGWDNNLSLFPTNAFTAKVNGNGVRTSVFSSASTGALTSLNYPEGGITSFTYELNDYKDDSTGLTLAGPGIRVKTITSYDPTNMSNPFTKNFNYKDASGNSTGVLVATPIYTYHPYINSVSVSVEVESGTLLQLCEKQFNNYHADFVSVNGTIVNQNLYYSYVTETTGNNDTTTRSDYYYNCNCGHQYDYFTGVQLTKQVDFKNTGHAVYKQVKETDNNYFMQLDTLFDGIKPYLYEHVDFGPLPVPGSVNYYMYDWYNVPLAWSYLSSETEKLFDDQGNTFTTTKTYNYNPTTRNVASALTTMSDGRTMLQKMKYPEDYTASVTGKLVTAHVLAPVIEEEVWLKSDNADSSLVAGKITAYDSVLFKPTSEYYFENSAPPVTSMNSEGTSGGLYTSLLSDTRYVQRVFYQYGPYGLLQQQSLSSDNINSFIWGYNSSLPVAAVKNAPATKIAYTGFEDGTGGGWSLTGSTISGGATGNYAFNGQLQKTVPVGTYVVTLWASGSVTPTVNGAAGTALITKNNWTLYQWQLASVTSVTVACTDMDDARLYPSTAQITTYTYRPGLGISTQSDVNNRVSFYEYDGFGRLMLIRDADRNIIKLFKYHYRADGTGSNGLE